jgi:hypothetical protein
MLTDMNATYPIRLRPATAEKVKLEIARRYRASRVEWTLDQMVDYAIGLASKERLPKSFGIDRPAQSHGKKGTPR